MFVGVKLSLVLVCVQSVHCETNGEITSFYNLLSGNGIRFLVLVLPHFLYITPVNREQASPSGTAKVGGHPTIAFGGQPFIQTWRWYTSVQYYIIAPYDSAFAYSETS